VSTPDYDLVAGRDALIVLGFGVEGEPVEIGRLPGVGGAVALAADQDLALLALPPDSVLVVGLESPPEPEAQGGLAVDPGAGPIVSLALQGERGYLLTGGGRLDILDLAIPWEPELLGSWRSPPDTHDRGFVAAGEAGAAYVTRGQKGV